MIRRRAVCLVVTAMSCLAGAALAVPPAAAQIVVGNSEADHFVFFYDNGSPTGESLMWNDAEDRFGFSEDVDVLGYLYANSVWPRGNLYLNSSGPDGQSAVFFWEDGAPNNRYLMWLDSEDHFYMNDDLLLTGTLQAGMGSLGSTPYNRFCDWSCPTPVSDNMDSAGDLFLHDDLEVGGAVYLASTLYMKGYSGMGVDGDQTIYFYDESSRTGQFIRWDNSENSFRISGDLYLGRGAVEATRHVRNDQGISLWYDHDNDDADAWFQLHNSASYETLRILDGNEAQALFDGTVTSNGIDYAEAFRIDDETLEAGDVVALELDRPGFIRRSATTDEPHLVGVISAHAGFVTGRSFDAEEAADPEIAKARAAAREAGDQEAEKELTIALMERVERQYRDVALAGRVPVKVDGSHGAIRAGDHLTSSPTPGHAMALAEPGHAIGIALEPWSGGTGTILAFIQPGWYGGAAMSSRAVSSPGASADPPLEATAGTEAGAGTTVVRDAGSQPVFGEELRALRTVGESLAGLEPVVEPVEAGDVLVADRTWQGWLRRGEMAADPAVVGVVSNTDGVLLGDSLERLAELDGELLAALEAARASGDGGTVEHVRARLREQFEEWFAPVAMSGIVRCKVDAGYGAVAVGDLLTTSPTPGHAMRAEAATPGTILGKALQSLDHGTGTLRVLVMLR